MLPTAIWAAKEAGEIIRNNRPRQVGMKKDVRDVVTDVDVAAQEAIVQTIWSQFPDHDIMAEESGVDRKNSRYVWIIDPLDGTSNYLNHLPFFCTSVALQCDGVVVLGAVYDLMNDLLFSAQCSHGAKMNGHILRASQTSQLSEAVIAMDWPGSDAARKNALKLVAATVCEVKMLRSFGSAALALCYVAVGWLDGFFHVSLEPWDAAAGVLIMREAGGRVTDFAGQPWRIISRQLVASNGLIHDEIMKMLQ